MRRLLRFLMAIGFTFILQGCAIYATPFGYSAGYYGYAPYSFGFNYWPHSYYSYRPYRHFRGGPGYHGWGGGYWGGRGGWYGGGHWGGGYGGWRGRW